MNSTDFPVLKMVLGETRQSIAGPAASKLRNLALRIPSTATDSLDRHPNQIEEIAGE